MIDVAAADCRAIYDILQYMPICSFYVQGTFQSNLVENRILSCILKAKITKSRVRQVLFA